MEVIDMERYLVVIDKDLDNYLQTCGFQPLYTNNEKTIYKQNDDLGMKVNSWHWKTNRHGKYDRGHYNLNSEKELEIELMLMG